jgi:hypothetical protein
MTTPIDCRTYLIITKEKSQAGGQEASSKLVLSSLVVLSQGSKEVSCDDNRTSNMADLPFPWRFPKKQRSFEQRKLY